jgi:glycosyltransferase involved in cell wall biosynthesis
VTLNIGIKLLILDHCIFLVVLKKLKVLHISTYDYGGAAIAALRLHQGLLKRGIDSKFLSLHKRSYTIPEVYQFSSHVKRSLSFKLLTKFGVAKSQAERNEALIANHKGTFELFSFPSTDFQVHLHPLVDEADIIHLHWISNFIDWPSFFANINKPIIWTLHDMNPFQGGFHYLQDRQENWQNWGDIESNLELQKQNAIAGSKQLKIVAPSEWLRRAAEASKVLSGYPTHLIRYGLDLDHFRPNEKKMACKVLNINSESVNLFFMADSLSIARKGFEVLLQALALLPLTQKITLITIGKLESPITIAGFEHIHLGSINDARLIGIALCTADCLILPSREDNLPNVMLEALACGIPVISPPVGGMAEVITTGENGILARDMSAEGLSQAINDFIKNKYLFDKNIIRQYAENNFSDIKQAMRYLELYKESYYLTSEPNKANPAT